MKKSKHGMTSSEARKKKINGHINEKKVAKQEKGYVISGTGKTDVVSPEGNISCKQGMKTQWALLCLMSILNGPWSDIQKKTFSDYINFLPNSVDEFLLNRDSYRNNPFAQNLHKVFSNEIMNLVKFFCGHGKIDIFHLTDMRDGNIYKIPSEIFFCKVEESIKRVYTTKGGKLVITGGPKDTIIFELEMRKGTNHKKVLFHSLLSRIIDIVKN